tara:strand:- start:656 stop:2320 length:1665 start_codon:yes stop_codon:yes gene_type:complete
MQMNVNQYSQMFGKPLTSEEIAAFQIHSIALSQLVNNAVFENEFDNIDFILDETVIATQTKKRFPNLYDKNNKLNETTLNSFLSQQNLKIDDLVKIIDYESRSRVFDKLFFKVNYPNEMQIFLDKHNNHTRNINLIKLNINDFELPNLDELDVSINNDLIVEFFNENINSYMVPEKRDVSYLVIDKNNYKNQFTPSDSQIENYYNNNNKFFLEPETRDFIQFNFKKLDEALKFRNDIASYKKEEIIKFANENNLIFNEFSKVSKNEVLEDLSKEIFGLQKDQISNVVETPLAKHIVVVDNIYPEIQKTLDQSKDEINNTLLQVELENFITDLKIKISQQILDGLTLNEIALDNSLNIEMIKNVERQNMQSENDLIKNQVIAKSFASNKDFVSDILDVDDNRSIVINVVNIENEKPYELSEIFETVSNDWINTLKIKSIETSLNETKENSKSFKYIANLLNSKISNEDIKLNDNSYPPILKNNIFANEMNEISMSITNDDIYISELKKIIFPNEVANPQKISMLSELRSNFGSEIIKHKSISTNDSLIQALISQY